MSLEAPARSDTTGLYNHRRWLEDSNLGIRVVVLDGISSEVHQYLVAPPYVCIDSKETRRKRNAG